MGDVFGRRNDGSQTPLPVDYDSDPARFAANQAATARFSAVGDVHVPDCLRTVLSTSLNASRHRWT